MRKITHIIKPDQFNHGEQKWLPKKREKDGTGVILQPCGIISQKRAFAYFCHKTQK